MTDNLDFIEQIIRKTARPQTDPPTNSPINTQTMPQSNSQITPQSNSQTNPIAPNTNILNVFKQFLQRH